MGCKDRSKCHKNKQLAENEAKALKCTIQVHLFTPINIEGLLSKMELKFGGRCPFSKAIDFILFLSTKT